MTSKQFNGHKNWNHWNVSLWINNDEGLYSLANDCLANCKNKNIAAAEMLSSLHDAEIFKTPDGAPYSVSSIKAAMRDM